MERKEAIHALRDLRKYLEDTSWNIDDDDPRTYNSEYCEHHSRELKASYTPGQVGDFLERAAELTRALECALKLGIDEELLLNS